MTYGKVIERRVEKIRAQLGSFEKKIERGELPYSLVISVKTISDMLYGLERMISFDEWELTDEIKYIAAQIDVQFYDLIRQYADYSEAEEKCSL